MTNTKTSVKTTLDPVLEMLNKPVPCRITNGKWNATIQTWSVEPYKDGSKTKHYVKITFNLTNEAGKTRDYTRNFFENDLRFFLSALNEQLDPTEQIPAKELLNQFKDEQIEFNTWFEHATVSSVISGTKNVLNMYFTEDHYNTALKKATNKNNKINAELDAEFAEMEAELIEEA